MKITPEELMEAIRGMSAEQHMEFHNVAMDAIPEEDWIEICKKSYSKASPVNRWVLDVWMTEQREYTELSVTKFNVVFPDGTVKSREVSNTSKIGS